MACGINVHVTFLFGNKTRDMTTIEKVILWHKSMRERISKENGIEPPLPELTYSTTRTEHLVNIGTQVDGYSCGIIASALACYWMLYRSIPQRKTFSATTSICEDFRIYMAHTILGEKNKVAQEITFDPVQPITIEEYRDQESMLNDCEIQQAVALQKAKSK